MAELIELKHSQVRELRAKILRGQNGLCPICARKVQDPVLDHSHKKRHKGTGQIRGVLCRTCNSFLAKSENNAVRYRIPLSRLPLVLTAAARYLNRVHLPYLHPSERPRQPRLKKSSYKAVYAFYGNCGPFPQYPRSGRLTKHLAKLYAVAGIVPQFYKE